MKQRIQSISFIALSVLLFVISPVFSTEETADPGVIHVMIIVIPTMVYSLYKSYFKNTTYNTSAILMCFFAMLSTLVGRYGTFNLTALKYICFVMYFLSVSSFVFTKNDIIVSSKIYNIVSVGLAVLIILSFLGGYAHNDSIYYMGRYSIGITGLYKNPNYLVSFMNVTLFLLLYSILFGRKTSSFRKALYIGIILLFLVAFYLTGTRASLATALIVIFILLIHNLLHSDNKIWVIIPVGIILYVIISYWNNLSDLYDLFIGAREMTVDEGRESAWNAAIKAIEENPILGCGLFSWSNLYSSGSHITHLHNIFLEFFLNQGVVGLFLLVIMLFSGFFKTKREDRFFILVFFFVTGFPLLFQNGVVAINFWRFIILNRIVINYSIRSKEGLTRKLLT